MKVDWKQLAEWAPMVLAFSPLAPLVPFIMTGIHEAGQIAGASGEEKLAHAVNIAKAGIQATNAQAGREMIIPADADLAIETGIAAVVNSIKLVNAVKASAAKVPETIEVSGGAVVIGTDKDAGKVDTATGMGADAAQGQSTPADAPVEHHPV
jgi:hypothetical protein